MKLSKYNVTVLRLGHRPSRDLRVTSHVALAARALGADGVIIADTLDRRVETTVHKVVKNWGGDFNVVTGAPWRKVIHDWKANGGEVIHLTMYGLNVEEVIGKIRASNRDKLVVVGASKVPGELYSLADYNVSVTNQPHSEVAALAVFLDRLFEGRELSFRFDGARLRVVSSLDGKNVIYANRAMV
ncbi:MAG: tRNA (cytidine(56)-2'-O)-methyltransferase [Candidatus Bathyarchaeia archaeon]